MPSAQPACAELVAPACWRVVDFVSDVHLHLQAPHTLRAWQDYLASTRADAIFILGDLFEAWIGDDAPQAPADAHAADATDAPPDGWLEFSVLQALAEASTRLDLFVMHGNRDFLVGARAAAAGHFTLIDDPTVLCIAGQRWLLSHGDELCTDDVAYQKVRAQVRQPAWQQQFLARPLAERRAFAQSARAESRAHQQQQSGYADVDSALARQWLDAARSAHLIHGHTHRPGDHVLGASQVRHVLSDWDLDHEPSHSGLLRLHIEPAGAASAAVLRLSRMAPADAGQT